MTRSITGRGAWNAANAKLANKPFDDLFAVKETTSAARIQKLTAETERIAAQVEAELNENYVYRVVVLAIPPKVEVKK